MLATIFEIKRFAVHDGDGIRTTVFFKGCPLNCVWCHNPEGILINKQLAFYSHKCVNCGECASSCITKATTFNDGKRVYNQSLCNYCGNCVTNCLGNALTLYGKDYSVDELLPILLEDKEFYLTSGGGVTLSGGEALVYADFCKELLKKLKENGIDTAVDTCGFVDKTALDKVLPYTDVFLYDIKAIDKSVHIACTGRDNELILDNLKYLDKKGAKIEVRIPFVPNYNDGEIYKIAEVLKGINNLIKVRVLPYHNYSKSKYGALHIKENLPDILPTDTQLNNAISVIKSALKEKNICVE